MRALFIPVRGDASMVTVDDLPADVETLIGSPVHVIGDDGVAVFVGEAGGDVNDAACEAVGLVGVRGPVVVASVDATGRYGDVDSRLARLTLPAGGHWDRELRPLNEDEADRLLNCDGYADLAADHLAPDLSVVTMWSGFDEDDETRWPPHVFVTDVISDDVDGSIWFSFHRSTSSEAEALAAHAAVLAEVTAMLDSVPDEIV